MRRRTLLVGTLALVVLPTFASAQTLLEIADCGGPRTIAWTCTANSGQAFTLVGSVRLPPMSSLTGYDAIVDFGFETAVPDWWRFGTGQCRPASRFSVTHTPPFVGSSCVDHFGTFGEHATTTTTLVTGPDFVVGDPFGTIAPSHLRMYVTTRLDSAAAASAPAPATGDHVLLFVATMSRLESAGPGACAGCDAQVCVELADLRLHSREGTVGVPFTRFALAMLQGESHGDDCLHGPEGASERSTWGQVKSLYR